MAKILEGVRVVEVALYGFVPSAAAVLADWGADVIKVEHPESGDPIRGLHSFGVRPTDGGVNYLWEVLNRGKRSVGVDLRNPGGHEFLMKLVDRADVFLTNFLGEARQKLHIETDDILARNPRIIYGRGTGVGPKGPEAQAGGFDGLTYWLRAGTALAARPAGYDYPIPLPGPAFGDIQTGMHLAGGVVGGLYNRERTGKGSVVDVSLLSSGLWAMQATMAGSYVTDQQQLVRSDRTRPQNPLTSSYRTKDDRFIGLAMLEADRYWPAFATTIGRADLVEHPHFVDAATRFANLGEVVATLDGIFIERTLDEWIPVLSAQEGPWTVVTSPREALDDQQAAANGYVQTLHYPNGATLPLVVSPVQFGEQPAELRSAPDHAAHTDEVGQELGLSWDELIELKTKGAIS
jgi:crotonobetainyl-CoA:carnitine CoA-transferase CaiB-like acyl-CoA transferase